MFWFDMNYQTIEDYKLIASTMPSTLKQVYSLKQSDTWENLLVIVAWNRYVI